MFGIKPRLVSVLASVTLIMGALAGCTVDSAPKPKPGLTGSGGSGNIVIGVNIDLPGMGLREGNTYHGFEIEVAEYVAGKLSYPPDRITFVRTPAKQRSTMISTGQAKLVVANYSITRPRAQQVDFAGPYLVARQGVMVRAGSPAITSPAQLTGRRVCALASTTSANRIPQLTQSKAKLITAESYSSCVARLKAGTVDAVTGDDVILAGFQSRDAEHLAISPATFGEERLAIGLAKGNTELRNQVNLALKDMIDSGAWQKAVDDNLSPHYTVDPNLNPPKLVA